MSPIIWIVLGAFVITGAAYFAFRRSRSSPRTQGGGGYTSGSGSKRKEE